MAPGIRSKFSGTILEPEVFRKQMSCIEESTCDIFGTFRCPPQSFGAPRSHSAPSAVIHRPHSDLASGELCHPCSPSLRCCRSNQSSWASVSQFWGLTFHSYSSCCCLQEIQHLAENIYATNCMAKYFHPNIVVKIKNTAFLPCLAWTLVTWSRCPAAYSITSVYN